MDKTEIPIGSDCRLELVNTTLTRDDGTTEFLNSGTCTYQLKTTSGTLVSSGTLAYYSGSNGRYLVIIDKLVTVLLTRNKDYDIFISFAQSGNEATFLLETKAVYL